MKGNLLISWLGLREIVECMVVYLLEWFINAKEGVDLSELLYLVLVVHYGANL